MARMLFLRDIDVDVHIRCRGCGHQGVIPRDSLNRRFGPNYPVLSIAPHFRCSRCDSRDTESAPAPNVAVPPPAIPSVAEPALDGPLAALQGLLAAAQAQRESGDGDDSGGVDFGALDAGDDDRPAPSRGVWPDDDWRDEGWRDEGWKAHQTADVRDADDDDDHQADADVDDAPVTRAAADVDFLPLERLAEDGPSGVTGRRPLWEPLSLADMASRLEEDEDSGADPRDVLIGEDEETGATDAVDDDDPLALADPMAALRALMAGAGHGDADDASENGMDEEETGEEEGTEPPVFSTRALVRADRPSDEDPADDDDPSDDDPSDDDILAFAIRDPEKPAPPWDRPRPRTAEPLDETLAALRSMVQEAAADRDRGGRPDDRPDEEDPSDGDDLDAERWPVDEAADAESEEDEEPPRSRKSAQEQEMEKALQALRDLVEEDDTELVQPEPVAFRPLAQGRASRGAQRPPVEFVDVEPMDLVDEAPDDDGPDWEPPPAKPVAGKSAAKKRASTAPAPPSPPSPIALTPRDEDEPPAKAKGKGKSAAKAEPSAFDKTIAALRNMLELDGKRDH